MTLESPIEPSENATLAKNSPYFQKKKIQCNVWSNEGDVPVLLATTKVGYGETSFSIPIGGKGFFKKKHYRDFTIIYDPKVGALKQGKDGFIYDTDFKYSQAGLAFHQFKESKMVDSKHAETMLIDGAIKFFIAKGGIPMWYLLICVIGMVVMGGALGLVAPQYIQLTQGYDQLVKAYQADQTQIQNLQAQLKQAQSPNGLPPIVGAH